MEKKQERIIWRLGVIILPFILLGSLIGFFASNSAEAALKAPTEIVTTIADSGPGSLRAAIANVDSGGTITFDPSLANQTITLNGSHLAITKSLTISSSMPITVSGNSQSRVFAITDGATVVLNGLTIYRGAATTVCAGTATCGGGIFVDESNLSLKNSTVVSNSATYGGGVSVRRDSTVEIVDSTISNNSASSDGGGLYTFAETWDGKIGHITVTRTTIEHNRAEFGAGISTWGGHLMLYSNTVAHNTATAAGGGGIRSASKATVHIVDTIVKNNSAAREGGGISNLQNMTVENSTIVSNTSATNGGGLYNTSKTLTLQNSTIANNTASSSGGGIQNHGQLLITDALIQANEVTGNFGHGGGIADSSGNITITHSIVENNTATSTGAGINTNYTNILVQGSTFRQNNAGINGGGLQILRSTAQIISTTIHNNHAQTGAGGGIFVELDSDVLIVNSTVTANTADDGGAISNRAQTEIRNSTINKNQSAAGNASVVNNSAAVDMPSLILDHTIVANSINNANCSGAITSQGHNLDSDGTCLTTPATGDLPNVDPLLGPLADNGGETLTHALMADSPAINAGAASCGVTVDQRGETRLNGGRCDIGAYESLYADANLIVSTLADVENGDYSHGDNSLREALANAQAGETITFDASLSGETITLNGAQLTISRSITISSSVPISVSGNHQSRLFKVIDGANATIAGLTLRDGKPTDASDCNYFGDCGGAIYINDSHLTLKDSTIFSNTARSGGGIANYLGTLIIEDSVMTENGSLTAAGAIMNRFGVVTIINSNIHNNQAGTGSGAILTMGGDPASQPSATASTYGSLTIRNSIISHNIANSLHGGAITAGGAPVLIEGSTIANNSTASDGGGLHAFNVPLTIIDSTFHNNQASAAGAAMHITNGEAALVNSTVSGNSADSAGGIFNASVLTIRNSTITQNTSNDGQGVLVHQSNSLSSMTIDHTIIANQTTGQNCTGTTITSTGHNLDSDGTCLSTPATGDRVNIDPQLGSLADNGGSTHTHLPQDGSPAIDAGDTSCFVLDDQRGVSRPVGPRCDIGAVEAAATPERQTITSQGPLDRIFAGARFQFQVAHTQDGNSFQFYPPNSTGGAAGTLLTINDTIYYPGTLPASGLSGVEFTIVSQSAMQGAGTADDPYRVVTIAEVGTTGLRLIQTDSYIPGEEAIRTDVQVSNSTNSEQSFTLYRAADCYLGASDFGYGSVNNAVGLVSCTKTANNNPAGRVLQFIPITDGSTYYQAHYSQIWDWIETKTPFPNTCRCDEYIDNGMGISWGITLTPGEQRTFSHITTLSPSGKLPLLMSQSADQAISSPGAQNGYVITITNPNLVAVTIESIVDTLPSGFSYVDNSTSGATSANPTVSGTTLTWNESLVVPADGEISLRFNVLVSTDPGEYTNGVTATATGYDVSAAQNSAPIVVDVAVVTVPSSFVVNRDGFGFADYQGHFSADFTTSDVEAMFGQAQTCARIINGVCTHLRFGATVWLSYISNVMQSGHSSGMVGAAMRFVAGVDTPSSLQPSATTVNELTLNNSRRHLAEQFARQATDPALSTVTADRQRTPAQVLQQIYIALSDSSNDPIGLAIWRSDYRAGHSLLPYSVTDAGSGIFRVSVYDPLHPNDDARYVEFDTNANTWTYDLGSANGTWNGHALSSSVSVLRLSSLTAQPDCPWCASTKRNSAAATRNVMLDGDADLLITDSASRRIGYVGGQFVNEIPNGSANLLLAGPSAEAEPLYTLPADGQLDIQVVGSSSDQTDVTLTQVGQGWSSQLAGLTVSSADVGMVTMPDDGSSLTFTSDISQNVSMQLTSESGWQFTLSNLTVGAGEQVGLRRDASTNQLFVDAPNGTTGTYDIEIRNVSSASNRTFVSKGVSLSGGDTQLFELNSWSETGTMTVCSNAANGSSGANCATVESDPPFVYYFPDFVNQP